MRQLSVVRAKRFLKTLAVVQDLADSMLAVNDIRGVLYGFMSEALIISKLRWWCKAWLTPCSP